MFEEDLKLQGAGTLEEIKLKKGDSYLPVPYWAWFDNNQEIIKILSPHSNEDFLKFQWDLVKNKLKNCSCFLGVNCIEIVPYILPIEKFGSFYNAKNRVYMSATINNDSFFIKHLNITEETIKNPLTIDEVKVSGERMILAPSMIDMNLDNDFIMQYFIRKPDPENQKTYNYGICVLTPSFNYANIWGKNGALVSNSNEISKHIGELKAGNYQNTIVFANRYDGLDLPDSACRILIFDGIPYAENLLDRYFQDCLCDSEIINVKIAQRIEQGLGRNVRSDRDFGAILLLRNDLIRFVMSNKYKKYFSPQTQKQIEIGELLVDIAKEETEESNSQVVFIELIKKILKRDDDWKAVYSDEMSNIKINKESKILEDLIIQRKAEEANYFGRSSEAVKILSEYINTNKQKLSNEEYGWYLQQIARYLYEDSKLNSINAQISAYDKNNLLLKHSSSINIKLLKSDKINQSKYIKKYIDKFETAKDLDLEVNEILDFLRFGIDSKKFENTVNRLGELLGFAAEQPDKMYNEGPDNLWAVAPNEYFVIEAKNEIYESRSFLSQVEIGQMNNTIGWFKKNYQKHKGTFIMIAPTHVIDRRVAFNDSVKIIRKKELINLKKNVACFIKDIINNDFKNIKNEEIAKLLRLHKLDYSQFTEYFVKPDDILVQKE